MPSLRRRRGRTSLHRSARPRRLHLALHPGLRRIGARHHADEPRSGSGQPPHRPAHSSLESNSATSPPQQPKVQTSSNSAVPPGHDTSPTVRRQAIESYLKHTELSYAATGMLLLGMALGPTTRLSALRALKTAHFATYFTARAGLGRLAAPRKQGRLSWFRVGGPKIHRLGREASDAMSDVNGAGLCCLVRLDPCDRAHDRASGTDCRPVVREPSTPGWSASSAAGSDAATDRPLPPHHTCR
jgi:hypothetical protein